MDFSFLSNLNWFDPMTYWVLSPIMLALALGAFSLLFEDIALFIGIAVIHHDPVLILPVFIGLYGGIVSGDLLLYGTGRWLNRLVLVKNLIQKPSVTNAVTNLRRRLWPMILISRAIPASRLPTFLAAGLMRVSMISFSLVILTSVALWTAFILFGGASLLHFVETKLNISPFWLLLPLIFFLLRPFISFLPRKV